MEGFWFFVCVFHCVCLFLFSVQKVLTRWPTSKSRGSATWVIFLSLPPTHKSLSKSPDLTGSSLSPVKCRTRLVNHSQLRHSRTAMISAWSIVQNFPFCQEIQKRRDQRQKGQVGGDGKNVCGAPYGSEWGLSLIHSTSAVLSARRCPEHGHMSVTNTEPLLSRYFLYRGQWWDWNRSDRLRDVVWN